MFLNRIQHRSPSSVRSFHRSIVACAFALTIGTVGCSSNQATTGSVVKLGIDLPESGADATDGVPTRNGAILAVEEATRKGLPYHLHLETSDLDDAVGGKHNPAQGAQNIKTFLADPAVLAVVGPFNSSVATAEIPLTNDGGLAQIAPSVTSDGLTMGDEALRLRRSQPTKPAFFRVCTTDGRQGAADARNARSSGYSRVYIVDDNETYGKGLADVFEQSFIKDGGTVVGHEHITANQQDFNALLTKAHATSPDLVFYGGTTSTGGGLLRKQMANVGMSAIPYFGGDGLSDAEFRKIAGPLAAGTTYSVTAIDATRLPSAKAFVAAYKTRFGSDPGPYSVNAYTAAQIAIAAIIHAAGASHGAPTRELVRANIAATKAFHSAVGVMGFDANGDTTAPTVSLYRIDAEGPKFLKEETLHS